MFIFCLIYTKKTATHLLDREESDLQKLATTSLQLVPIRLELESPEGHKLKDTFTWNLHGIIIDYIYMNTFINTKKRKRRKCTST
jgi:hypothetical protein